MRHTLRSLAATALVLAGLTVLPAPARAASICTADGTGCLTELAFGPANLDLTRVPVKPVTLRMHLTSSVGFATQGGQMFLSSSATTLAGEPVPGGGVPIPIKLTSGTAKDGWWTGSITLTPGYARTHALSGLVLGPLNGTGQALYLSESALTAAGFPNTVTTTVTTGPPAVPSGLTMTTGLRFNLYDGKIETVANAAWFGPPSGGIGVAAYQYRTSGSCDIGPTLRVVESTKVPYIFREGSSAGWCYITVRALNAEGASAWTGTARAWLP